MSAEPFMSDAVVALCGELYDLIAAARGPSRLTNKPVVIPAEHGAVTRVGAVWFIDAVNHGYHIDAYRDGRAHRVEFWTHGRSRPVGHLDVLYRTADIPMEDLVTFARMVGLLPAEGATSV